MLLVAVHDQDVSVQRVLLAPRLDHAGHAARQRGRRRRRAARALYVRGHRLGCHHYGTRSRLRTIRYCSIRYCMPCICTYSYRIRTCPVVYCSRTCVGP